MRIFIGLSVRRSKRLGYYLFLSILRSLSTVLGTSLFSVAWANDNTEVIAFALQNEGYTVGIPSLGSADTIAPAVSKGNTTLLDWINDEIASLGEENFFHADYEATLADTYGLDYEDSLVVEGGKVTAQ